MTSRRAWAIGGVVLLTFLGTGCGGVGSSTQAFYDEVDAKLCTFQPRAISIGRDAAAFADSEQSSTGFDANAQSSYKASSGGWRVTTARPLGA
jgi:hypothetical protein